MEGKSRRLPLKGTQFNFHFKTHADNNASITMVVVGLALEIETQNIPIKATTFLQYYSQNQV